MLVAMSKDVIKTLNEVDSLQETRENAGAIKATFDELQKMLKVAYQIDVILSLLRLRFSEKDMPRFTYTVNGLLRELRTSQQTFEQTRNQEKVLSNLSDEMQGFVKELKNSWRTYAVQRTKQPFELFNLVRYLPEVQDEQAQLMDMQNRLTAFFDRVPTTPTNLAEFDQILQELKYYLGNVSGLNESVRQFLQKTLTGQATLVDMTDEVLDWCRQGTRASAFAIRFVQ
ncbi:MAG TPA: hypothetical protein VNG51_26200 [Ktedonobacteraceae bacterium]|nr:hypothetical protein [Ktedonobacteraceae bacterium]